MTAVTIASAARAARAPERAPRVPERAAPRSPRLTVVPAPVAPPRRAPFLVVSVVVLAAGLVALLLLNTWVQQGAFRLDDLRGRAATLQEREQALRREVVALEAPGALAARARALGLVPGGAPAFRLGDGRVLGNPGPSVPSLAPVVPRATPSTSATSRARTTAAPHATKPAATRRTTASPRPTTAASSPGPRASARPTASPRPSGSPR